MTAIDFAKKNGFVGVRKLPEWNGLDCYEALYVFQDDIDDIPAIGYPQLIFADAGGMRMATFDETLRYMAEVDVDDA